jgi:hypothetical protein
LEHDLGFQLAHQRGIQAVIWGMPAVSIVSLRLATFRDLGARYNDVVYMSHPPLPRHELLTASHETPQVMVMLDTRKGPVVLEVPPASGGIALSGTAVDAWMVPLVDIGPFGEDAGEGGRFVFFPPGHAVPARAGFLAVPSKTYNVHVGLLPVFGAGTPLTDVVAHCKRLHAYPYAQAERPPANRYIDAFPKAWRTLPRYDMSYFETLARALDEEPVQEKDAAMIGLLASIGIRRGVPFLPELQRIRALERAVEDARRQMERYFETPGLGIAPYRPDGQWMIGNATPHDGATYLVEGKLLIDERAGGYSYWARFAPKRPRANLYRMRALRDSSGHLLKGTHLYRLRMPRNMPARDHWSLTAYGKESKAYLANDLDRVGLASCGEGQPRENDDGSIELFFGPDAPRGMASNWVPTGVDFFLMLRLYEPQKTVLDRSFRMPDVERVN